MNFKEKKKDYDFQNGGNVPFFGPTFQVWHIVIIITIIIIIIYLFIYLFLFNCFAWR